MARAHPDLPKERGKVAMRVYLWVEKIPRGRVMTYGQIAALMGNVVSPRAVGWFMHQCPKGLPWQRVVNASGGCSTDRLPGFPEGYQQHLLEREGVLFKQNSLDLEKYRWIPRKRL